MKQTLETTPFKPGEWLLDVGSNTCWASNRLAQVGLNVIALDIATHELQGLYTSDYFIAEGLSYFERVVGSMNDMPIASESLDYVFCCEVLHHNDPSGLINTFKEAYRVLKPGGRVLIVNETLKTVSDPVGVNVEGVAEFDGYEHAHWAFQYRWAATRAGFVTRVNEPTYHWFFRPLPDAGPVEMYRRAQQPDQTRAKNFKSGAISALKTSRLGRRAFLAYVNHVRGDAQLQMVAVKPAVRGSLRRAAQRG
jgi:ubiquinone/menaquinone biosynthesis C-methylase UbiE